VAFAGSGGLANVSVDDTTALTVPALSLTGNLNVTAAGITQSGPVAIAGTTSVNAGVNAITLTNGGNDFAGTVFLNNSGANNVAVADASSIQLGTSAVGSGTLTVNAVGITQSGPLTQAAGASTARFNAGAGAIGLTDASNDFTGAVVLNNSGVNNVAVTNTNAIQLGTSSVGSGTLTVSATGITQSGTLTQAAGAGTATFNAGAGAITLTNAGNDLTGAVCLNNSGANNVSVADANAIQLGNSSVGSGALTVNAVGILRAARSPKRPVRAQPHQCWRGRDHDDASIQCLYWCGEIQQQRRKQRRGDRHKCDSARHVRRGQWHADRQCGGNHANRAAHTGRRCGYRNAQFGAGAITLTNASNDFTGAVALSTTGNASVTDINALNLGASTVGGNLAATVTTGNITDSGVLTVSGNSSFTANQAGASISVNNSGNTFTGAVSVAGSGGLADVSVSDTTALAVPALTLTGNLTVTAAGITQSGPITVAGTTNLTAGASAITVTNAGNDFTGAVSLDNSGPNNVAVTGAHAIELGASSVGSGTLTVNAVGITESGPLAQAAGAGIATFSAGAGAIALTSAANDFTGAVALNNSGVNNVSVTDTNAIQLATSSVGSGTFTVNAVGLRRAVCSPSRLVQVPRRSMPGRAR